LVVVLEGKQAPKLAARLVELPGGVELSEKLPGLFDAEGREPSFARLAPPIREVAHALPPFEPERPLELSLESSESRTAPCYALAPLDARKTRA
jgi:hypothetical protein